jgi:hypothetical protein
LTLSARRTLPLVVIGIEPGPTRTRSATLRPCEVEIAAVTSRLTAPAVVSSSAGVVPRLLASKLERPRVGNFVMSFLDASIAPLSTVANSDLNFRIYDEGRVSHQVSMWVNRYQYEPTVTVLFPDNAVARESVIEYIAAMKAVYGRVAAGRRSRSYAHSLRR